MAKQETLTDSPAVQAAADAVSRRATAREPRLATPVVPEAEWREAIERMHGRETAATRQRDALAAERRRLPRMRIDEDYLFEGADGRKRLHDLFDGRRQLVVYHFMFAPGVDGWPDAGCPGCSMFVDQIGHLAHLHARDTSLVLVSRGPIANLLHYRRRMGWTVPWYSSAGSDLNVDMYATTEDGETHLLSVFGREGDEIYRTYFTRARGVEALGPVWSFLDLTPFGRQESWEDSPIGYPQGPPYEWWRRHDEYDGAKTGSGTE
jgi:predicted dithiol-disulfide oxidoreductase (DUF899 family)